MNIEIPVPDGLNPIELKEYRFPWAKSPFYRIALYFEDAPDRVIVVHRRELSNGKNQYLNLGLVEIIGREAYNAYLQDGIIETMANNCSAYMMADKQTRGIMRNNLFMLQRTVRKELTDIVSAIVGESENSETIEPVNESEDMYMVVVTGGVDRLYYAGEYDPVLFELMRTLLRRRFEHVQKNEFSKSDHIEKK